jgi:hypothetical protein
LPRLMWKIRTQALVALMARTENRNDRIRAAYPNAPHKSGTAGCYLSDAGFVAGSVIVVMGKRARPEDLADEARAALRR